MTSRHRDAPALIPLQVFVVEDEFHARSYLVELIHRSGRGAVVGAVATRQEALEALALSPDSIKADLAFVDVNLGGARAQSAGLELVRDLVRSSSPLRFVLATASGEHALEAYELGVLDYLRKPFTLERVERCLERVRELLVPPLASGLPPTRLVARSGRRLMLLRLEDVLAFEAAERLVSVHAGQGRFDVDLSLSALEASFGAEMVRVHRNWLIRLSAVTGIERDGPDTTLFLGESSAPLRVCVARERAPAIRERLLANTTGLRRT
jgi:two-component system, LytTR family, response regulator LytT